MFRRKRDTNVTSHHIYMHANIRNTSMRTNGCTVAFSRFIPCGWQIGDILAKSYDTRKHRTALFSRLHRRSATWSNTFSRFFSHLLCTNVILENHSLSLRKFHLIICSLQFCIRSSTHLKYMYGYNLCELLRLSHTQSVTIILMLHIVPFFCSHKYEHVDRAIVNDASDKWQLQKTVLFVDRFE